MKPIILSALCFLYSFHVVSQKMMSFAEKPLPKISYTNMAVLDFCSNQAEFEKLDNGEKEFYYLVNFSRNKPMAFFDSVILPVVLIYPELKGDNFTRLKKDFEKAGSLPMLRLNTVLDKMAKTHAVDIASHNANPSHNSTTGESFNERFKVNKLIKCGGENISFGREEPVFLLTLLYLDIGVPNLGHRLALLNPNFTETGIGNSFYNDGAVFLVEDFACSQN